jgi:hypothetical protein
MILQQDKGSAPQSFDTGLPRVQTSEDVPRWLIVLGMVAACTLLVALLRYAIDLLGVVFLIILVGFSIRTVSDWLTEGESVSAWALAAVFAGLFGTVLVGMWLFGARDIATGTLERGLPSPVMTVANWLEGHGWAQRVLLGSGGGITAPSAPRPTAVASSAPRGSAASPRSEPAADPFQGIASDSTPPTARERKKQPRVGPDEAEASTRDEASSGGHGTGRRTPGSRSALDADGEGAVASRVADMSVPTTVLLATSRQSSLVGTSVRFTATVLSEGGGTPSGVVVFLDGDRALGMVPVRGGVTSATAVLSTLDLALGDHLISAEFHGSDGFLGSRSDPISQSITRR